MAVARHSASRSADYSCILPSSAACGGADGLGGRKMRAAVSESAQASRCVCNIKNTLARIRSTLTRLNSTLRSAKFARKANNRRSSTRRSTTLKTRPRVIQAAHYQKYRARILVLCMPRPAAAISPASFVTNSDGFCSVANKKFWRQATFLYAKTKQMQQ